MTEEQRKAYEAKYHAKGQENQAERDYVPSLEHLHNITAQALAKVPAYALAMYPELRAIKSACALVETIRAARAQAKG